MKKVGIYAIINKINQKMYIGSSRHMQNRKYAHFKELEKGCHSNSHLQRAYNKYGKANFEFKILLYCRIDELLEKERDCIAKHDTTNRAKGYNVVSDPLHHAEQMRYKLIKLNNVVKRDINAEVLFKKNCKNITDKRLVSRNPVNSELVRSIFFDEKPIAEQGDCTPRPSIIPFEQRKVNRIERRKAKKKIKQQKPPPRKKKDYVRRWYNKEWYKKNGYDIS